MAASASSSLAVAVARFDWFCWARCSVAKPLSAAIAHECGIEFTLFDVAEIFRKTPYIADLKPGGPRRSALRPRAVPA